MQIGQYEIKEAIAVTKRSMVFRGKHLETGRDLAFKQVQDRELALTEAGKIQKYDHPNIIKLYDTFQSSDQKFILVLEFIQGQSLHVAAETMEKHEIYSALLDVAKALRHIHEKGDHYGDLKKSNILFDQRSHVVKLIDFGTRLGDCSLGYLAPEHNPKHPGTISRWTDIYQFGIICEELLPEEKHLVEFCKVEKAEFRPSIEEVCVLLEELLRKENIRLSGEFDAKFMVSYRFMEQIPSNNMDVQCHLAEDQNGCELMVRIFKNKPDFDKTLEQLQTTADNPLFSRLLEAGPHTHSTWRIATERIQGEPFFDWLKGRHHKTHKLLALIKMAEGLAALHKKGNFHGHLREDTVLYDAQKDRTQVKEACIKRDPSDPALLKSPEHETNDVRDLCPASDVYVFGRYFLSSIPGNKLKQLTRICTALDPFDRPSMSSVVELLKKAYDAQFEATKRTYLAAVAATVLFVSSLVVPRFLIGEPNLQNQLRQPAAENQGRIVHFTAEELKQPLAVMLLDDGPILLGFKDYAKVGDVIQFGNGDRAIISDIGSKQVVLNRRGIFEIKTYDDNHLGAFLDYDDKGVLIWPHQNNLRPILKHVAALKGLEFEDRHPYPGKSLGYFSVSNLDQFLAVARQFIDIRAQDHSLILEQSPLPPLLVRYESYIGLISDTEQLGRHITSITGLPVQFEDNFSLRNKLEVTHGVATWQAVLDSFEIDWQIQEVDGEATFLVRKNK